MRSGFCGFGGSVMVWSREMRECRREESVDERVVFVDVVEQRER